MDQPRNGNDSQQDSRGYDESARWMTFAELAAARGISKDSAVSLIRRRGWRRQKDNQGHVRALVPLAWAEPAERHPDREGEDEGEDQGDAGDDRHLLAGAIAALEASVMSLTARAEAAEGRAERAEKAVAGERSRADALRERLDRANADAQAAAQRAEALEATERARKGQGALRRVWHGLRGR
jgi:hypothetical protein